MFTLTTSIDVNAPVEFAFAVLWDVQRYPEFLSDVVDVTVDPGDSEHEIVAHYVVRSPRRIEYALNMRAQAPERIEWTLDEGELQRHNRGSWSFATTPDGALLTLEIQMEFNVPVPDVIMKKLVEFNLPVMMRQVRARIEQSHRALS